MSKLLTLCVLCFLSAPFLAEGRQTTPVDTAYVRVTQQRADKIVATLNLDAKKGTIIRELIAKQYQGLTAIYDARDARRKALKASPATDKTAFDEIIKADDLNVTAATDRLHAEFLAALSPKLTSEQVDKVKDGLTYNVLNVTYTAYQAMIPTLTADQKKQILAWLIEAREHAMDGESSEKKHAWFGKYKGKINNYLSAAGYNMKEEEAAWMKRIKSSESKPN